MALPSWRIEGTVTEITEEKGVTRREEILGYTKSFLCVTPSYSVISVTVPSPYCNL